MDELIVDKFDQITRTIYYMQEHFASLTELAMELQSQLNTLRMLTVKEENEQCQ